MIEAYFGLNKQPFTKDLRVDDFYNSFDLREASARLEYIKRYRGVMLLTGEPGAGKTALIRKFADSLNPQSFTHCYTPHATVSKNELYRQLNFLLQLPPKGRKSDLFDQIQRLILEQYYQGKVSCLILDECQMMDHATLQELILLTNFEMDSKLPFILLLIGQPEFRETLKRSIHEPLNQRIQIRYHMAGLSPEETGLYISHHLKIAGRADPLVDPQAVEVIHQLAHGLPRKVGKITLSAMTMAMIREKKIIDPDLVLEVATEV
jgi:general secretion pathway protein A